jgi:hypothetical protein
MKHMIRNKYSIFLILLLLSACAKTFDSPKEMMAYITVEENGYCYKKSVVGVDYTLQYRPTDLLVNQEVGVVFDKKKIKELRAKYNKYLYFNLSMSRNKQELLNGMVRDKAKFGQMVNDLAFNMDQKVHVYTPEKDTLPMADFIYSRMFGMTNNTSIMIVYPRDAKALNQEYLSFSIEDLGLFTGEVRFKLNTKAIKNEPQLQF